MTKPVKVAHAMGRLDIGGAERMLLALCRGMDPSRFAHQVIALSGRSGSLTRDFAAAGVGENLCSTLPLVTFPARLFLLLRRLRPDVMVSHVSMASGMVLTVARLAGIPRRVAVFHSDGDGRTHSLRRRAYRWASRQLLVACATDVVGVTSSALALSGFVDQRKGSRPAAAVISNAVDLTRFVVTDRAQARRELGLPTTGRVVLHAGRGAPEKNRRLLPPVLSQLPSDTVLLLAGSSTTDDLQGDVLAPDLTNVRNLGELSDIRPALSAADVLLLPSVREGMPLVVLEAIASGVPVVASRLPGLEILARALPDLHLVDLSPNAPVAFARAAMATFEQNRQRQEIHDSLAGTSFDLDTAVRRWTELCDRRV